MRTRTLIGAGLAVALAGAMLSYQSPASAQPYGGSGMMGGGYGPGYGHMRGYGPGMMGGSGPGYGHMGGWGGGSGQGQWNCPAFGRTNETGSGPADSQGQGYGPGNRMRGWGGGYGPGMMHGYGPGSGPGYGPMGDVQGNQTNQTLNLTTDEVKSRMERWLVRRDNPRLKVGEVKEKDADTITADIVTKDDSLVERFIVDRHTGFVRRDNS
ncbi:MAG TPA: hypothetical protein VIJ35_07630 [Bradyrhizobium sp.]